MRVYVTDLADDTEQLYEGTPAMVEEQLLVDHPFLRTGVEAHRGNINFLLRYLGSCSTLLVQVEPEPDLAKTENKSLQDVAQSQVVQDMLGFEPRCTESFEAARFLAGGRDIPFEAMRRALWEEEGDLDAAALKAFSFVPDEANLKALAAVKDLDAVKKAEFPTPSARVVLAATPEAQDVAEAVGRAFKDHFVFAVQLAGKHSSGSLVARDQETQKTWLLKPGSGGKGVAAGSDQDPSDEPSREAAWYHVAKAWGLHVHFPRAELLLIDGRRYAALALLPWSFLTLGKLKVDDPNIGRRVLGPLLGDGVLHQWAVMDYVCGNPDDHEQNVMVEKETQEVRLVDHGSAFAGNAFDPANDKSSFIPAYLRAWAPLKFNGLKYEARVQYMPRVSAPVAERLGTWVEGLNPVVLTSILHRYGINPEPDLARLARLKESLKVRPADDAINQLWLST